MTIIYSLSPFRLIPIHENYGFGFVKEAQYF